MPENKRTIVTIGELLWDILPDRTILGGAPSNIAFRLNELGDECFLVSRIGNDELGNNALAILKSFGLSTSFIQQDLRFPTGTVNVSFDNFRNPDYVINPNVAFDYMEITSDLLKITKTADYIAFGTLAQRSHKSRETITELLSNATGAIKFLDVNLRKDCYTKRSIEHSMQFADVLKINHHEAVELNQIFQLGARDIPKITRELSLQFDIRTILVTIEENGVFLFDKKEGEHYIPGYQIKLSDPLGSGDAFSAAFIHYCLQQKSLVEACTKGNQLGAAVATTKGATTPVSKKDLIGISENAKLNIDQTFLNYINESI
jgi:fructokinase